MFIAIAFFLNIIGAVDIDSNFHGNSNDQTEETSQSVMGAVDIEGT